MNLKALICYFLYFSEEMGLTLIKLNKENFQ